MKLVEHWRWRWRNPANGQDGESNAPLTVRDATARFPNAERIPGTSRMLPDRSTGRADEETVPAAFYHQPEP